MPSSTSARSSPALGAPRGGPPTARQHPAVPFGRAHLALLPLFPVVVVAFWPGYFGQLRAVPWALHLHGVTATLWIALVAFQSWTIGARRPAAHRAAGVAVFALVPVFTAGGLLVMRDMAALAATRSDPFHTAFGMRLALGDAISVVTFLGLVCAALARRRRVWVHGGAMLATVLLVLPPVTGRLFGRVPGFPSEAVTGLHPFALAFELAQLLSMVVALVLARRYAKAAPPFVAVATVLAAESLTFETVARSAAWNAMAPALAGLPTLPVAVAGAVLSAAALWAAWTATPRRVHAGLLDAARVGP